MRRVRKEERMSTNSLVWILICICGIWFLSASEYEERKLGSDDLGGFEIGGLNPPGVKSAAPSASGVTAASSQSAKDQQRVKGWQMFMEWCRVNDYRYQDYRPDYIAIDLPPAVRDGNGAALEASKKYFDLSGEIIKVRALPGTGAACNQKWVPDVVQKK